MSALVVGFGLGMAVAAQVGLAIGAGVAVVDTAYAAAGALGASGLLALQPLRLGAGVAGALVLAILGVRTLWSAFRVRMGGEATAEVASPRRAFLTTLAAT